MDAGSPFSIAKLRKSSKLNFPCSNSLPLPESKEAYLFARIFLYSDFCKMASAVINARAKVSIPPICAWNKSAASVEFLLRFASKLMPPLGSHPLQQ